MLSPEELHSRGIEALNVGRLARGRSLLVRAHLRAIDDEQLARVEASLAYVMAETGERERALVMCDEALARPAISAGTRGLIHGQRGLLLMLAGRTAAALDDFEAAVNAVEIDDATLGRAHLNRGGVHLQRSELETAESDFRLALRPLSDAGLPTEASMAEHNIGYCRFLRGDLVGALQFMDRARVVLAPMSPVNEATCDQDRAEVLMAAGLIEEGRVALDGAARAYGSRQLRRRQGEAELALARTLVLDDPDQAHAFARKAVRHFRAADAEALAIRAEALGLTAEVNMGRSAPSLLARGRTLEVELDRQGLHWGATLVRLQVARVLIRREDVAGAAELLTRVRVDQRAPLSVRLLSCDVRAELAARQGRRSVALTHLRLGLSDLHAWQSSFGSLDLQTTVAGQGTRLGVRGLALAIESRSPAVLLEWSERARMLASRVQPVSAPPSEDIVADLVELRALAQPDDGPAAASSSTRVRELRRRVREKAWQHRGSGEFDDPCSLPELQAGLGSHSALVAHIVTADRVVALVVTDAGARRHDLGERSVLDALLGGLLPDLDVASTDLPSGMAGFVRQELAHRLDDLAQLLVEPLVAGLGERQVVLTPSGTLAGVPWTLLPGLTGRPVTVAQSATSWLGRRTTPLRVGSAGFVAGPRVSRADDEVLSAAEGWTGATVLRGQAATAAAVSELASSVDVLHIAAHGRHSAENPMFSGVQLVDGPWFGYDIDQLRAVPDVVLLSACEVGRSSVRAGEELIGMTAAWLHAGARCVIASAAAVSDSAAHDVLVAVHEGLASGADPAAALAKAVPMVSADRPPTPFVCFG